MNQAVTVTGMILSAAPVGDYDKRVVILTKERGKISAFARGARRPNSSLVGVTTPFAFGEMTLYEGKSSYNLVQADISNYFSELRMDMEGAYYGFYFMEFADYYTKENNDEREMLKLLYQSLRALVRKTIPYELIRYIFESVSMGRRRKCLHVCPVARRRNWKCSVSLGRGCCAASAATRSRMGKDCIHPQFMRCSI